MPTLLATSLICVSGSVGKKTSLVVSGVTLVATPMCEIPVRSVGIPALVTSISAPSLWLFVDHRRIYADIENVSRFEPMVEAHACAVE